ncbi:uncharacterized protein LOC113356897 [Papaver somniferum]|uniref:uncharacterized protein LOC113356897 n=1 Tax=Papaver somniferum TaxID=3469 RepID=UPI000E70532C|nr:uncharacterized protein LOC113356897 [Papaver somniferum]
MVSRDTDSISKALAAAKCWFIWKERCLRIFEDKSRTPEQLALDIIRQYDYWHPTHLHNTAQANVRHIKPTPYWQFPRVNTVKINCDASWISEHTNAGFGFVICNWTGTFKGAESGIFRTSTAEEAEALTLLQATNWTIANNLQHLVIEGDNQAIIKHLQGENSTIQWQSLAILEEVRKKTAKNGRKNNRQQFWLEQSPQFLIPSIAFDTEKAYAFNLNNSAVIIPEEANLRDSVIRQTIHTELATDVTQSND